MDVLHPQGDHHSLVENSAHRFLYRGNITTEVTISNALSQGTQAEAAGRQEKISIFIINIRRFMSLLPLLQSNKTHLPQIMKKIIRVSS